LYLDFAEQEFDELVKNGLDINTPNGVQHISFELCSCADAKFLALLQRQIANNNTHFSLVSPDITAASKTDPNLSIGEGLGQARPYTLERRRELYKQLQAGLEAKKEELKAKGVELSTVDLHAKAVALLKGPFSSWLIAADVCAHTEQGHGQEGWPRNFGLVLVDVLHLLFNCVKAGLRRYLRMLAWLSAEFKLPTAYFEAFIAAILGLSTSHFSQLAGRVKEKQQQASLSLDGGSAAILLREHAKWLEATLKLPQTDHTRQLHVVLLHLFRRMQHILQIACSSTVSVRAQCVRVCRLTSGVVDDA
jgi:hypothetical protein